ncbi:phage tail sheath C-terminal domain-containing protein [Roseospira visakhapatnamensis]|uniref:Phage tail protein n=1 Tax=Roseospira visakhapatnamensis TaxID=390880 RepID=A0A7W6WAI6_9PROT|nr:phage tail sheath C-terminal domain-containing protein [Roseospira visakhapatnamensis]MBB4266883.1 hypothetical protein [Roseospira visakhapatnamensis]
MTEAFYHGPEVIEVDDGIRPIRTPASAIIGLIGTAPDADAATFPLDTPVLLLPSQQRRAAKLGAGTLKDAVDAIWDQGGATIVLVRVTEGQDQAATLSAMVGDQTLLTGVHAFRAARSVVDTQPRILIAPGYTGIRPTGVSAIAVDAGGTGYDAATTTVTITPAAGDTTGTGAQGTAVITDGAVTGITLTRPGIGYTAAPTVTIAGDGTGATATAQVGTVANPVVAELLGIAVSLRAVILADGPNTTLEAAAEARKDWGSPRVFITDPYVQVWDTDIDGAVDQPASARVAGVIARMDNERGFWWSPSNQVLNGIIGTSRPVGWAVGDVHSEANWLNEREVTTVIRREGFRLWGNRTCSEDPLWAFLSVRRTADMVYDAVEAAFVWAMDRPLSPQLVLDVQESVNAYLRSLKARGAILGGRCWLDPELNTPDRLMAGHLTLDFDIEPPAPMERLTFRAHREDGYYTELVDAVIREAA